MKNAFYFNLLVLNIFKYLIFIVTFLVIQEKYLIKKNQD